MQLTRRRRQKCCSAMRKIACMKYFPLLIVLLFPGTAAFSQTEVETLDRARLLIAEKKYASAFDLLDTFDPGNSMPEPVLLKEEIVLKYFVTSIAHQIFTLLDIGKDEDILQYRGKEGTSAAKMFAVNEILDSLILAHPTNYKLHKGLGEYYFEVHLKYGSDWIMEEEQVLARMEHHFKLATEHQVGDNISYYVLGYLKVRNGENREAIRFFQKSIALDSTYATAHYNAAYAFYQENDRENALKYAKQSFELYDDKVYKGDAARMIGFICLDSGDESEALKYFELSLKIDPDNPHTLKALLELHLKSNNKPAEALILDELMKTGSEDADTYVSLTEIYHRYNREKDLHDFFDVQIKGNPDDQQLLGNLHFFSARLTYGSDAEKTKAHLLQAKACFAKVFDKDHNVFQVIDQTLSDLK